MAKILIPHELSQKLGPSMAMDVHWIDVKLKSGKVIKNLVVRNSSYISGSGNDPDGIGPLEFVSSDIADIRRHSVLPWIR